MMAPAMTAPPTMPAAIPGPHPHPRCHQAEASVAGAATITTIVAAPSKLMMVFLHQRLLGGLAGAWRADRDSSDEFRMHLRNPGVGPCGRVGDTTADLTELIGPKMSQAVIVIRRGTLREYERHITE
jgi:hypothetical protein